MQYMGRSFKAPRRAAVRQWRKVELLIQQGYRFESLGTDPLPGTLRKARDFVRGESGSYENRVRRTRQRDDRCARQNRVDRKRS